MRTGSILKPSAKDGHESLVYEKPTQQINEHAADLYCGHEEVTAASAAGNLFRLEHAMLGAGFVDVLGID